MQKIIPQTFSIDMRDIALIEELADRLTARETNRVTRSEVLRRIIAIGLPKLKAELDSPAPQSPGMDEIASRG